MNSSVINNNSCLIAHHKAILHMNILPTMNIIHVPVGNLWKVLRYM